MVSLKEKTEEVLDKGRAERGIRKPSGWPLRNYRYYEANGGYIPPMENFCHYWRVALLWAPYMKYENLYSERARVAQFGIGYSIIVALLGWVWIWFAIVGYGIPVVVGLGWLATKTFPALSRVGAATIGRVPEHMWEDIGMGVFGLFVAAVTIYGIVELILGIIHVGWIVLFVTIGVVVCAVVAIAVVAFLGVLIEEIKDKSRQAKRDARYAYYKEHGEWPPEPTREPGAVTRVFRNIGDFIVLVAQIIRVKKWKICPIMDMDNAEE